jgi:hypothetical protein
MGGFDLGFGGEGWWCLWGWRGLSWIIVWGGMGFWIGCLICSFVRFRYWRIDFVGYYWWYFVRCVNLVSCWESGWSCFYGCHLIMGNYIYFNWSFCWVVRVVTWGGFLVRSWIFFWLVVNWVGRSPYGWLSEWNIIITKFITIWKSYSIYNCTIG